MQRSLLCSDMHILKVLLLPYVHGHVSRHSVGPAKANRRAAGSEARGCRCVMAGARRKPSPFVERGEDICLPCWFGTMSRIMRSGDRDTTRMVLFVWPPGAPGPKFFATPRIPMRSYSYSNGTTWRMLVRSLSRRTYVRRCNDLALMDNLTSPTWMTPGKQQRDPPNV
jgi:hypothetical protein